MRADEQRRHNISVPSQTTRTRVCRDSGFTFLGLTDRQWARMEPMCLGKVGDPGRTGGDGRIFLEAILWIARTGSPWRDLPPTFGHWSTVFARFRYWSKAGVFRRIFDAVSGDPDMCYFPYPSGRRVLW